MTKPKIAVVNSSSTLSICYSHLDDVSALVQDAIRAAGGLPFEVRTVAPSDFVTSAGREARYLMPSRDLLVNDIEVMVEGALLDGMICLSSCDKTTPAHLMAAVRLDIPTLVVACGYQVGGTCGGRDVDIDDVYESVGAVAAGKLSIDELTAMTETAITGPGVCAGLGTANSMQILAEVLGMALPGSTPIRAGSDRLDAVSKDAGKRIVAMVREDLRPRRIVTENALGNAVTAACALGLSVNVVRHLTAIAREAELNLDIVGLLEERAQVVPLLAAIRPNGPNRTEDLDAAGGTQAVLRELRTLIDASCLTVTGGTVGNMLDGSEADVTVDRADAGGGGVIHGLDNPISTSAGLTIVRGSLAPDGAVVKVAATGRVQDVFEGQAKVFASEADAVAGISDGSIVPGQVVVLRHMGPLGGPGTVFACGFVAALNGAGIANQVAVVTDGELSGLNRGITVGQVMPEAAEGGPLAVVQDGDGIRIDLAARRVDVVLSDDELARRLDALVLPDPPATRGWLGMYRQLVRPLHDGAVLSAHPRTDHRAPLS